MVIVLLKNYVSKESPYSYAFVHTRVRAYINSGIATKVFVLNSNVDFYSYSIDGVDVYVGSSKDFQSLIASQSDVTVCIHFIDPDLIECLETNAERIKKAVVFVHGFEALHWYQRLFPYTFTNRYNFVSLLYYIQGNTKALSKIRRFLRTTNIECQFVAVSNWMKNKTEKAWNCKGQFKWHIIPNYIDSQMFAYEEKDSEKRKRLLSIRPFTTGKYANDLTAKVINLLNDKGLQNDIRFTWVGDGPLYDRILKIVRDGNNIHYVRRMLLQGEIVEYHRANGVFICPTRQDAQGVSMCEAMSSGLVPVTLYNTAIPEFLPEDKDLICHNENDMAELICKLQNDEKLFFRLSKECSLFINKKCSYEKTIQKEIKLYIS